MERLRVEFTHTNYGSEIDCIEPDVCLTRSSSGPLYNRGAGETEWACGRCGEETSDYSNDFRSLKDNCADGSLHYLPRRPVCLHIVESGAYWDVLFDSWTSSRYGGGFSYVRERTAPLPLQGPNAAEADIYSIPVVPGPAALLRIEAERDVPVVDASGAAVAMDVTASVADKCGNARTTPDVTFDLTVGHAVTEVEFAHSDDGGEQDCIEPDVCLTRDSSGPVYNDGEGSIEWACGRCGDEAADYFDNITDLRDNCFDGSVRNIVGRRTCLSLPDSGAFWDVRWTQWTSGGESESGGGGGFAYVRTGVPPGSAGACFDALCPDDGGSGTTRKEGATTTNGQASFTVYSHTAGWVGFSASDVTGDLPSGGWTVGGSRTFNFEADGNGFEAGSEGEYTSEWEWGRPPQSPGAHTGTRAWATALQGDYRAATDPPSEVRWLRRTVAVPCPLDEEAPVRLSFWEHHDIAPGAVAYVAAGGALSAPLLSADGAALYDGFVSERAGWQGATGAWRRVRLDLDEHRCEETDLYWVLYLDGATERGDGLTIDDVSLEYLGPRPNANFAGGPVKSGTVTALHGGIAACATSPGVARVFTEDEPGNAASRSSVPLTVTGVTNGRISDAEPGRLTAPGANATVDVELLGWTDVNVLADSAGTATLTLKAPAGDATAGVDFVAATANEGAACEDGADNDCDGKRDCADPDCEQVEACLCPDGSDRTRAGVSCRQLHDECGIAANGPRWLDPNGGANTDAFQAYCDMGAGGFTLIMKLTGAATLGYDSSHWTSPTSVLGASDLGLGGADAKYASFNTVPFTTIRGCVGGATTGCISHTFSSQVASAVALFSGPYRNEGPGRNEFDSLFGFNCNDLQQCNCGERGFNYQRVYGSQHQMRVRWGYSGNNEGDCNSNDSVTGFGGFNGYGGPVGAGRTWNCCNGTGTSGKNAWLWVK
jgi:hypothetical protein